MPSETLLPAVDVVVTTTTISSSTAVMGLAKDRPSLKYSLQRTKADHSQSIVKFSSSYDRSFTEDTNILVWRNACHRGLTPCRQPPRNIYFCQRRDRISTKRITISQRRIVESEHLWLHSALPESFDHFLLRAARQSRGTTWWWRIT